MSKKRILTGDRPTGKLHIGHYFGSLKKRIEMQESGEYDPYILIADVQALTDNFNNPEKVRKNVREVAIDYLSVGIDPKKTTIYIQSMIPEVAELTVFYSNLVTIARLQRNPTVKTEIAQKRDLFGESVTYGFLGYPVNQAADITAFEGELVPVGEDQLPLIEQCREIVRKFNSIYGDVFTIPEAFIGKVGAKIMSLQDPSRKMSKSDENVNASIYLMDDADTIMRKCKRAVTDSEGVILYRDEQPGVKNLINIYSACTGKTPEETVAEFDGRGYGDFKMAVGEAVVSVLKPLQEEQARLINDKAYIDNVIKTNAEKADYYAVKTLRKVQRKIGFPDRIR